MQDAKINSVLIALRRVIRASDLHSRNLIKTTGLTAPQLLLLQTIRFKGEVTIGELAREMSLSQATVTSILDRLEGRGYVFREKSTKDKRKVHAYLTEKGEMAVKDAPAPLQTSFVKQFKELKDWEQSSIIASLQRVAEMMDAQFIDAPPVLDIDLLEDRGEAAPEDAPDELGNF